MDNFSGKTVLITGADGGIGAEIATEFIAQGATVFLSGVQSGAGRALAIQLGTNAYWLELDVSREDHWQSVMTKIETQRGRLDILVNNAGYLTAGLNIEDTSLEQWQRHFAVNVDGQFLGCKYAIGMMKKSGGGAIVNMSSAVALRLHSHAPAYGVSKSAVHALTRVTALYCNQNGYNIRVNAVLPGPVNTPMMRSGVSSEDEFMQVEQFLLKKYAMARIGMPSDIANAVLFLCSDKSEYITGSALVVDGGQSA